MTYAQPLLSVLLLMVFGALILKPSRVKTILGASSFVVALLLVLPIFDWVFSRPLELGYVFPPAHLESAQAIVVLSSSILPPLLERPYYLPDRETYERCLFAAWLFKTKRPVPIVASGGPLSAGQSSNAAVMKQLLVNSGVPESVIWVEEQSRSTHENALFSAAILRQHGVNKVLLVVEAQSMRRAEACFRQAGIEVLPAPSARRRLGPLFREMIPNWRALYRNEVSLHELGALAWYRLRGWI